MLETSSIVAIGYLIYSAVPILVSAFNWVRNFIMDVENKIRFNFACGKCISFWACFLITGDWVSAALISLTVFLMDTFIVTKL